MKIYSVYDSKAEAYMAPWYARTKGEAIRSFEQAVINPETQLNKHPADYTLFELGEFDEYTGTLTANIAKTALVNALDFGREKRPLAPVNN